MYRSKSLDFGSLLQKWQVQGDEDKDSEKKKFSAASGKRNGTPHTGPFAAGKNTRNIREQFQSPGLSTFRDRANGGLRKNEDLKGSPKYKSTTDLRNMFQNLSVSESQGNNVKSERNFSLSAKTNGFGGDTKTNNVPKVRRYNFDNIDGVKGTRVWREEISLKSADKPKELHSREVFKDTRTTLRKNERFETKPKEHVAGDEFRLVPAARKETHNRLQNGGGDKPEISLETTARSALSRRKPPSETDKPEIDFNAAVKIKGKDNKVEKKTEAADDSSFDGQEEDVGKLNGNAETSSESDEPALKQEETEPPIRRRAIKNDADDKVKTTLRSLRNLDTTDSSAKMTTNDSSDDSSTNSSRSAKFRAKWQSKFKDLYADDDDLFSPTTKADTTTRNDSNEKSAETKWNEVDSEVKDSGSKSEDEPVWKDSDHDWHNASQEEGSTVSKDEVTSESTLSEEKVFDTSSEDLEVAKKEQSRWTSRRTKDVLNTRDLKSRFERAEDSGIAQRWKTFEKPRAEPTKPKDFHKIPKSPAAQKWKDLEKEAIKSENNDIKPRKFSDSTNRDEDSKESGRSWRSKREQKFTTNRSGFLENSSTHNNKEGSEIRRKDFQETEKMPEKATEQIDVIKVHDTEAAAVAETVKADTNSEGNFTHFFSVIGKFP